MVKEFEIEINKDIKYMYFFLEQFKEWIQIKREIKLIHLLEEGKKIQFDIENIRGVNTSTFIYSKMQEYFSISDACATVNNMQVILNGNIVEKITMSLNILDTPTGKIIKELIKSDIDLKLKKEIFRESIYFHFDLD